MGLFSLVGKIKIEGAQEAASALQNLRSGADSAAVAISSRLGSAVRGLGSHLHDAAKNSALLSVALTGAVGAAAFQSAAKMDSMVRALASVSTGSQDLMGQLTRLKKVAELPGLGFEEAIQGSVALQSAGYSANLAERALMSFGNALASAGKGKADLDGVALALQQIASKGKISAEEINQLRERTPQVGEAMKRAFGSADTEIIGKSGIGAVEFVSKLVAQMEKLPKVSGGIQNSIENLQDGIKAALRPLGQGIADFFGGFGSQTETLMVKFEKFGQSIGEVFSAIGKSGVINEVMGKLFGGLSLGNFQKSLATSAGYVLSFAANIRGTMAGIGDYIHNVFSVVKGNVMEVIHYMTSAFTNFSLKAQMVLGVVKDTFASTIEAIGGLIGKMVSKMGPLLLLLGAPGLAIMALGKGFIELSKAIGVEAKQSILSTDLAKSIISGADIIDTISPIYDPKFKGMPSFDVKSPFADASKYADKIMGAIKPYSMLPDGLIYGGGAKGADGGSGSVFAQWDKHLTEIEKNTKSTADALDPRKVLGGGELAKIGVTEAERSRSGPDPYTRSLDNTLRSAIRRAVRADQQQTSRKGQPLWAR